MLVILNVCVDVQMICCLRRIDVLLMWRFDHFGEFSYQARYDEISIAGTVRVLLAI